MAPAALASCTANIDTPPVPWVSTTSPGLIWASTISARQAVSAAQGRVAAWVSDQPLGRRVKALAGMATYSAAKPSTWSPGTPISRSSCGRPATQPGKNVDSTWSPSLKAVTPSPTPTTSPAPSDIGTRPSAVLIMPETTAKSWKFSELARTRTRISPGPAIGSGRSVMTILSSPPGAVTAATFMAFFPCGCQRSGRRGRLSRAAASCPDRPCPSPGDRPAARRCAADRRGYWGRSRSRAARSCAWWSGERPS